MSQTRKSIPTMNVDLSQHSSIYSHAYTTNAAFTLFYKEKSLSDIKLLGDFLTYEVEPKIYQCLHLAMLGHRGDTNHPHYHQSEHDFEQHHTHILKISDDRAFYERITPKELDCYLNAYRETQSKYGLCTETNDYCLIDEAGIKQLKNEYNSYYRRLVNSNTPKTPTGHHNTASLTLMRDVASQGLVSGYINAMLDYYFIPLMMDRGVSASGRLAAKMIVATTLNIMLFGSLAALPTTVIVEMTNRYFEKAGSTLLPPTLTRNFMYLLNLIALSQADIINMPMGILSSVSGQVLGRALAMRVISHFPKLKQEPAPEQQPEGSRVVETSQQASARLFGVANASGLRRRSPSPTGGVAPRQ